MQRPSMEDMAGMAEEKALLWHFNFLNFKRFRRWFVIFGLMALISLIYNLVRHGVLIMEVGFADFFYATGIPVLVGRALEVTNIVLVMWFLWVEEEKLTEKYGYQTLLFYLYIQYGLMLFNPDLSGHIALVVYLFFILPWLRIKASDHLLLYGMLLLSLILSRQLPSMPSPDSRIFYLSFLLPSLGVGLLLTYWRRVQFLKVFRVERGKILEKRRFYQELDAAKRIQLSMLPATSPDCSVLDVAGACYPASEVGGDYYDFLQTQAGQTAIVTGDVSGHGLASGLVLASVRGGLYVAEPIWDQPDDLLKNLNVMLKRTTEKHVFMTFVYLLFDIQQRQLKIANAGHQPVMHFEGAQQAVRELRFPALPLGGVKQATFPVHQRTFQSGDMFLIYTDGLNEAFNRHGEDFGVARVLHSFQTLARKGKTAREICDALWDEVSSFMKGAIQEDDITLVVVRCL